MLPWLNMSADVVWFTRSSVNHYQILESTPPQGYNSSISAAYKHVVQVLTALCEQHGESQVFTGNHSYQVEAYISSGQSSPKVFSLADATAVLLGVADQGGGCPVAGQPWPMTVNISAGPLGGNYSHSARYEEILQGRAYDPNDAVGRPTGPLQFINWTDVHRFAPNPSTTDFLPAQCVAGGSWVIRNDSFFVKQVWDDHAHHLATSNETTWEACAEKCDEWTITNNQPLAPCAMYVPSSCQSLLRHIVSSHLPRASYRPPHVAAAEVAEDPIPAVLCM